nr:hypothetical protein [Lactiplantibacillus argentoratensis]
MYYFVGTGLGLKLTGIEKAQLNRLALFDAAGYQARCVYVTYNPRLHEHAARFGAEGKCFSVYDFFQGRCLKQRLKSIMIGCIIGKLFVTLR